MSKLRRAARPLPEVMQTASQLGCRSVHTVTQLPGRELSPAGCQVCTFIFLHFGTIQVAEPRGRSGIRRPRQEALWIIHVNDFSERRAQFLPGMGTPEGSWCFRASRSRAWPRRTSSRGSRADRRSIRRRLRPRSGRARVCCARRRREYRPCRNPAQ